MNLVPICQGVISTNVDGSLACSTGWVTTNYDPLFPDIDMADAYIIMTSVLVLWSVAWGIREIVRFILNRK